VREDRDIVAHERLGRGEAQGDGGWAASLGIERRDDVEKSHRRGFERIGLPGDLRE
jgi:hypothetical protein